MTIGRILVNGKDKGSGFALATPHARYTRVALTANHVVGNQEASSIQFASQSGGRIPVERVERDDDLDIAVLRLGEDVPDGLAVSRALEGAAWQVETQPLGKDPKLTGTVTATNRQFVKGQGRPAIHVLQLLVDQNLDEYRGYSGSPVALKLPFGPVIGVLVEQLLSRLSGPIGQPKPATNVLYAISIQDVLERFHLACELIEPIHVPFMCEQLPPDFVPRPHEFDALISKLLDENREEPIAITAALHGAGGYGKTTMARALCHNERIGQAFDDGILWVTLGENPGNLVGKVEDLIYMLSHERPSFTGIDAAGARLAELLADRDILLVIDDVWNPAHLRPFLQGGKRCARLITTRNNEVLPINSQCVQVDRMREDEAVRLLSAGFSNIVSKADEKRELSKLSARMGKWPLLLKLANGALRKRINTPHRSLSDALIYINRSLDKYGMTAFDASNPQERDQAVKSTLRVSFELLSEEEYARYKELSIFPEDTAVPLAALQKLWEVTGGLDDLDIERLCGRLYDLSLLLDFDLTTRTLRLHDVVRSFLRQEEGEKIFALHNQLLDAYGFKRWTDLPAGELYLWTYLAYHLIGAKKIDVLLATVKDLRYLATKAFILGVSNVEVDLDLTKQEAPGDSQLSLLRDQVSKLSNLLSRGKTLHEVECILLSRLCHQKEISLLCQTFEQEIALPLIKAWHPFPDLVSPALIRTLQWHKGGVRDCAVIPQRDWIVSASDDQTLEIWDAKTGTERLTLRGHTARVGGCAVSPAGDWIVSASDDQTLKIWDAQTGKELQTLRGHTNWIRDCAVSPTGDWIVSASDDQTLKVWDVQTGAERLTLRGHTDKVRACAVSPAGDWIVSASDDQTLKVWDAQMGMELRTLRGHTNWIRGCAVSPTGDWIVSASDDGTLRLWDVQTGKELQLLRGHSSWIRGCAVSPARDWIVSTSNDQTLKVWDIQTGTEQLTLKGHTSAVTSCAVSPAGDWIVSASADRTLKLWDPKAEADLLASQGHTARVTGCAVSPAGDWIVSVSDDQTLKVWDVQTGLERLTLSGHTSLVARCAVSPAGDWIVSASADRTLKVWDAQTGAERLTLQGHAHWVTGCAVSPTGDWIVSTSGDRTLKVWDAQTGTERLTLRGHTNWVIDCAVSPTGDWIVSASSDRTLKVWDAQTGAERLTLQGHTNGVTGCAISSEGNWIVSVSSDQTLKLWDVQTGDCLATLHVDGGLSSCAFLPDGMHFITTGDKGVYFLTLVTEESMSHS